jgi:hypothetical protein
MPQKGGDSVNAWSTSLDAVFRPRRLWKALEGGPDFKPASIVVRQWTGVEQEIWREMQQDLWMRSVKAGMGNNRTQFVW